MDGVESDRAFPPKKYERATCFPLTPSFSRIVVESAPPSPASCLSACFLPPPSLRCQIVLPVCKPTHPVIRRFPVSGNAHRHDLPARSRVLLRQHGQVQLRRDVGILIYLRLQRAHVLRDGDGVQGRAGAATMRTTCWVTTASSRMTRCDRHARHLALTK
jgi:hypothetical protein